MDLSDLFEFDLPFKEPGPRGQKVVRIAFGLLLVTLSLAGVMKGLDRGYSDSNWFFNAFATLLFIALVLVGSLNVILGLRSRWPAWLIPLSFLGIFLSSVLLGP